MNHYASTQDIDPAPCFIPLKDRYNQNVWLLDSSNKHYIVLMGGVHPEEEFSTFCLANLLEKPNQFFLPANFGLIVIPCRITVGFDIAQTLKTHPIEIKECSCGKMIICDKKYFFFPQCSDVNFWTSCQHELDNNRIVGEFFVLSLRCHDTIRANRFFYDGKHIYDSNQIPDINDISYSGLTFAVNNFSVKWVVDLHEGLGLDNYVYLDENSYDSLSFGNRFVSKCNDIGIPLRTEASDRKTIKPGVFSIHSLKSYDTINLIENKANHIIVEGGIDATQDVRLNNMQKMVNICLQVIGGAYNGETCYCPFNQ